MNYVPRLLYFLLRTRVHNAAITLEKHQAIVEVEGGWIVYIRATHYMSASRRRLTIPGYCFTYNETSIPLWMGLDFAKLLTLEGYQSATVEIAGGQIAKITFQPRSYPVLMLDVKGYDLSGHRLKLDEVYHMLEMQTTAKHSLRTFIRKQLAIAIVELFTKEKPI